MNPAELDKRITLQAPTQAADGRGSFTVSWRDMAAVWAKKTVHRSDEAVQAMMTTGTIVCNWRIVYRRDVRASWRIKEGNRYFGIIAPPVEKVDEGQRYLDITAKGVE